MSKEEECNLLPHHEQQELCTTRLPYRQGRKLTAIKAYTINNESKHLLIFGVPSLNLRQEAKVLFMKFGKLTQFNVTKHPSEQFTEAYHAIFECIQSARLAKKMIDTKEFYGGILHVCYAPEFETVNDTKEKLLLRRNQVMGRLKNLNKEAESTKQSIDNKIEEKLNEVVIKNHNDQVEKMYMGSVNKITFGKRKFKEVKPKLNKKVKMTDNAKGTDDKSLNIKPIGPSLPKSIDLKNINDAEGPSDSTDIIDCTSTECEVISNINEALNYNNFGNEVIKKIPQKQLNKIQFNIKKTL